MIVLCASQLTNKRAAKIPRLQTCSTSVFSEIQRKVTAESKPLSAKKKMDGSRSRLGFLYPSFLLLNKIFYPALFSSE